jgi:hypothetical protein
MIHHMFGDAYNPAKTKAALKETCLVRCLEEGKAKKLTDWTRIEYP